MGTTLNTLEPADLPLADRKKVLGGRPSLESAVAAILSGQVHNVIVAVGAGISVSAGIPDFRSPGTGVYETLEEYKLPPLPSPESLFTLDYFLEHPEAFCKMAKHLVPGAFQPTPTHHFLKLLHAKGLLARLFTQNIDGLERIVGIPDEKIVEAHGSFADVHCANKNCRRQYPLSWWRSEIEKDLIPLCDADLDIPAPALPLGDDQLAELYKLKTELLAEKERAWAKATDMGKLTSIGTRLVRVSGEIDAAEAHRLAYPELLAAWETAPKTFKCGKPVKPDIVFFGEALSPRFSYYAERDGTRADLLIVLGTSLAVMPFAGILGHVSPLCPRMLFNRDVAGTYDQAEPPMFFGNIGFRFSDPDNYRDVFVGGDIDNSIRHFCNLLGWSDDLRDSLKDRVCKNEGFEIFEKAHAMQQEFDGSKHHADFNHCLQLFHAMGASDTNVLSDVEYDTARRIVMDSGQDFLPEFKWFTGESDERSICIDSFIDGLRRLFQIVGHKAFHESLARQIEYLVERQKKSTSTSIRILLAFKAWDRNGVGVLTKDDIRTFLSAADSAMSQGQLDKTMNDIDQNSNGTIEYFEFAQWMIADTGSLDKFASLRPAVKAKAKPKASATRGRSGSPSAKARASRSGSRGRS